VLSIEERAGAWEFRTEGEQVMSERVLTALAAIDRLAVQYQTARLHKRRMHRCVALAVERGDVPAARAALAGV
jgi:hypothetical protein